MTTRSPNIDQVPDCISCGACCFSTNPRYVRVTGEDYTRLGEFADSMTQFIENRCYMRIDENRCIALTVDSRTKRYLCALYELRPHVCRSLAPGSPNCLAEIDRKDCLVRSCFETGLGTI
jgi:Fe-S-cluster containining protein